MENENLNGRQIEVCIRVLKIGGTKISNAFLLLIFRAGTHKMLVRIGNSEYPDQTASSR